MCGRYRLSRRKELVEQYFDTTPGEEEWTPRYNVAPTQPVPVIRQNPKEPRREMSLVRWGLIPSWAKDSSGAARMINARSETAATKPAFRDALKFRRCMIPADGFHEWQRTGRAKQPYCFDSEAIIYHSYRMTMAKDKRTVNHRKAFELMLAELADNAIDTTVFDAGEPPFRETVLHTTWEELSREGYVEAVGARWRLTTKGWLLAIEATFVSTSPPYRDRLGRLLAVMKRHVKGRRDSAIVELRKLAGESGEPEGWIFNVIDSRASSAVGLGRTGARWYGNERGRLVEIPVDFNLEPIDIASALTVKHLEKIQELEQKIEEIEEDRSQFHCPHCDAPISAIASQDFEGLPLRCNLPDV